MPGRVYLKIFISFIGVLVVTLMLVAALFRNTEGDRFIARFKRFASNQAFMVRTMVEERAAKDPGFGTNMQGLVDMLAKAYRATIWITDDADRILVISSGSSLPDLDTIRWKDDKHDRHFGPPRSGELEHFSYRRSDDDPHCMYAKIPFGGNVSGTIHYFFQDDFSRSHERSFLVGLIGICVVLALLVAPISWIITCRLHKLRRAALRIAEGDLDHRVKICGKDEVARVGQAFNTMADSLARMIRASRELTANVSHELRTPLTRIRIAEEILREQFGEKGATYLDSIREDVEALDALIGKLLDLSKLDLKESRFNPEPVEVGEMSRAIVKRLAPIAEHRSLSISTDLPSGIVIPAEGEPLNTALTAILENGVKHATENGWLSVSLAQTGGGCRLVAANSHVPLPEAELEAIFEPFRRAKGTMPHGTGLGLAIARKIIERHGGSVVARNIEGGVEFVVNLPG